MLRHKYVKAIIRTNHGKKIQSWLKWVKKWKLLKWGLLRALLYRTRYVFSDVSRQKCYFHFHVSIKFWGTRILVNWFEKFSDLRLKAMRQKMNTLLSYYTEDQFPQTGQKWSLWRTKSFVWKLYFFCPQTHNNFSDEYSSTWLLHNSLSRVSYLHIFLTAFSDVNHWIVSPPKFLFLKIMIHGNENCIFVC